MTIIVFLIDTSASMNQRAYLGGRPTLLDVAKGAVETFVKVRAVSSTLAASFFRSIRVVWCCDKITLFNFPRCVNVRRRVEGTGICCSLSKSHPQISRLVS